MGTKLANWFKSTFGKKEAEVIIKNHNVKIANVMTENWRGIVGTIPLLFVPVFLTDLKTRPDITVKVIWMAMGWMLLIQPVNVPVTGLVPVFAFPCLHVMSSDQVCTGFLNPTMILFIVGGYVLMLLNNCGFDKRVILWLLSPRNVLLTTHSLVIRSSFAAFILSMFSNRQIVTSTVMEYVCGPLMDLKGSAKERGSKTDYNQVKYILCNAIATSSAIGSTAILNTSFAVLAMRTVWELHGATPDVFNFFQYSVFALPVASIMFILNLAYHILLMKFYVKTPISSDSLNTIGTEIGKVRENIPPKITLHEILSIISLSLCLILYFLRWSEIIRKIGAYMGWADFGKLDKIHNPRVADATVSSMFAILLHIIPKSYNFAKYFKLKLKKSELPPAKCDTGILFWRFVDKNTNYGYILLIGGGVALNRAVFSSGLAEKLQERENFITSQNWNLGVGIVCLIAVILSNVMTSVAAVLMILPFVLNMVPIGSIWYDRVHLCSVAVGMGCSFGFALPFRYTPAYYIKEIGKVPVLHQIKYAVGSAIICFLVLWLALCVYAAPVFVGDTRIGTTSPPIHTSFTKKYFDRTY